MGKVKHSQRMSATPLLPWVVIEHNGEILAAHCTCMAGLGESCSHIAAILSCLVWSTEIRLASGTDACTSKKCVWLPPAQNVTPAPVADIVFSKSSSRKLSIDGSKSSGTPKKQKRSIDKPTEEEISMLYSTLNTAKRKSGILKLVPPYANYFIPKLSRADFPQPITQFYNSQALEMDYLQLLAETERVFDLISITPEQVNLVENETKGQSVNKSWYIHRAGRVTASNFKAAALTNINMPSQSLIKIICYPEAFKFSTEATRWGCTHESDAIKVYTSSLLNDHEDVSVKEAGFLLILLILIWEHHQTTLFHANAVGKGLWK